MHAIEQDERKLRYPGWRVAAAASGAVFFSFASLLVYTFSVFLKPITQEFHWSRQAASMAFGFAALCVAVCSPGLGALLDRVPPRRILIPCFAVFGTAFASLSLLTNHLWHLYLIFIVLGIVGNGTAHLAYSGALTSWFYQRRGLAFALLMSGGALGAMVLPAVAQWLISSAGWRASFAFLGLSVLLIGLPLATRVKRRNGEAAHEQHAESSSVTEALVAWPFWIILIVLFAASLSQNGAIAHLAALLSDRGISPSLAALAMSVLGGATLAGRLVTGWLLDRYFAPRVAVCLLSVAALGAYLLAAAHSAATGCIAAALIGFGMGAEADITPYLISRYFGLSSFSTLYGFSWTVYAIAGAVGPVIMGRAFDMTGSYGVLLSRLAVLTLATAALMLLLPRYTIEQSLEEPAAEAGGISKVSVSSAAP
jgi:predicted MFS family arabinose efflux permease